MTTSRIAIIANDWRTCNLDVQAVDDRGHVILFHPPSRWVVTAAPSRKYPAGGHQIAESRSLAHVKRVLKRVGLPENGKRHTFRHSFISHAVTNNVPEAIVRRWVGHVDAEILKLYTHIADTVSQAALQRLSEANQTLQQSTEAQNGQTRSESDSAQFQHKLRRKKNGKRAK